MQANGYGVYVAIIIALVGAVPTVLSALTRRKESHVRGEVNRFEALLQAQDRQLEKCEERCDNLSASLRDEQKARIQERGFLMEQLDAAHRRSAELDGILNRRGWKETRARSRDDEKK